MRRCLIVAGGWPGHEPEETSARIAAWLGEDGFEVEIARDLGVFAEADLAGYDLIVPNWTNGRIDDLAVDRLRAAVIDGTGLAGFHGGMGDGFRENVRFQFLVGGQFVGHPGGIKPYTVRVTDGDHPITLEIDDFRYHSEQYYLHIDPSIDVLATTRFDGTVFPWIDGVEIPVVWTRQIGAGRVFYSSLGHVAAEFDHPAMSRVLRRGLNWAARVAEIEKRGN